MKNNKRINSLEQQIFTLRNDLENLREEVAALKANLDWNTKITTAVLVSLLALIFGIVAKVF